MSSEPPIVLRTVAGLRTGTCVAGSGIPVVALHGWGGSVHSFWPVAERLAAEGFAVHLLDLPGFGHSDPPPIPWGVADYMHFVLAYLDASDLPRVALLGHSFGGRIGLVLAAQHPQRISKMVLANSAGLRTPLSLAQRTRSVLARAAREMLDRARLTSARERLQAYYNRRYASEDYLSAGPLRETFLRVIAEDLTPYASQVQAPTVLIWGDRDADTPLWQGRKLEQLIPDAGLIVFQGAGHFSYLERLNEYLRIVTHFLADRSRSAHG
ncbi:MAG: alpha/beta hydrolase [Anaerolineae bacterium]|nr:alpha/beta hydrolase [Anaerolineae bacterium]